MHFTLDTLFISTGKILRRAHRDWRNTGQRQSQGLENLEGLLNKSRALITAR